MGVPIKNIKQLKSDETSKSTAFSLSALQSFLNYDFGGQRLKDSFKEQFYSELALLIDSGLNLKSALELLSSQQKKQAHSDLIKKVLKDLTAGAKFSEVLRSIKHFTEYEYYSIKIGEEIGALSNSLGSLAEFFTQKIKQRRNLIGAISYPMVILFTAFLAIAFMFYFMVPMFKEVFARMGNNLPSVTKWVIKASENFIPFATITLLLVLAILLIHHQLKTNHKYRTSLGLLLIRLPIIGPLVLKGSTLRMLKSMSTLLRSKVPLVEALDLSARMLSFYPMKNALHSAQNSILKGKSLYEGLSEDKMFGPKLLGLIKVGEESNKLAYLMDRMAVQAEEDLDHQAKMLGNTLEPLIIVFLGAFVALILIAMYMPMFQLSASF